MKEVAAILNVTPRTVAFHKYTMMEQLNIKTGAELIQYAIKNSIVEPNKMSLESPGNDDPEGESDQDAGWTTAGAKEDTG